MLLKHFKVIEDRHGRKAFEDADGRQGWAPYEGHNHRTEISAKDLSDYIGHELRLVGQGQWGMETKARLEITEDFLDTSRNTPLQVANMPVGITVEVHKEIPSQRTVSRFPERERWSQPVPWRGR